MRMIKLLVYITCFLVIPHYSTADTNGTAPYLESLVLYPYNDYSNGTIQCPVQITFEDPDGDLKGGWLLLNQYKIELSYKGFDQYKGSVTFPFHFLESLTKIYAQLIDSNGNKGNSLAVDFINPGPQDTLLSPYYILTDDSPLYDNFDGNGCFQELTGNHQAVEGSPNFYIWAVSGNNRNNVSIEDVGAATVNYAARFINTDGWKYHLRMHLISPRYWYALPDNFPVRAEDNTLWIDNFGSFSADVLVSSESTASDWYAGLEFSVGFIPPDSGGWARRRAWSIVIKERMVDGNHKYFLCAHYFSGHYPENSFFHEIKELDADTWHTLTIESFPLYSGIIRLNFYLDNERVWYYNEPNSELLMGNNIYIYTTGARSLTVYKEHIEGNAIAYFDNVYGKYEMLKNNLNEIINIPDPNFKAYLIENFDLNGDGDIEIFETRDVKEINTPGEGNILDLTGIESFTNLITLICSNENISGIPNLSTLKNLSKLYCSYNQIDHLQGLSELTNLKYLSCDYNKIEQIPDLKKLENLFNFSCSNNLLTDVPNVWDIPNSSLRNLWISRNHFNQEDCPDIQKISDLNLNIFNYNPNYNNEYICE